MRATTLGERQISKLFSPGQRDFYAAHAPTGLDLDQLSLLGPLNVLKLKFVPEDFGRKMAVELWLYPDGSRVLELSTKCAPNEAFQVVGRGSGLPGQPRRRPCRRASDEDGKRAEVLLRRAESRMSDVA